MDHVQAVDTLASERYLLGEMSDVERDAFEDHFFSCNDCAQDVRAGALLQEGVKAGFVQSSHARAPVASTLVAFRPRTRRWSTALPWAMAATLAGVTAYQSLWVLPDLRSQVAPQALDPIVLRPASRGADPVVALRAGHPVALAVDVSGPDSAGELSYDLRNAAGATVLTGRAPMPSAGTPLLLLVPGTAFTAPGRYVLKLSDTTRTKGALGEYRFVVETR